MVQFRCFLSRCWFLRFETETAEQTNLLSQGIKILFDKSVIPICVPPKLQLRVAKLSENFGLKQQTDKKK